MRLISKILFVIGLIALHFGNLQKLHLNEEERKGGEKQKGVSTHARQQQSTDCRNATKLLHYLYVKRCVLAAQLDAEALVGKPQHGVRVKRRVGDKRVLWCRIVDRSDDLQQPKERSKQMSTVSF